MLTAEPPHKQGSVRRVLGATATCLASREARGSAGSRRLAQKPPHTDLVATLAASDLSLLSPDSSDEAWQLLAPLLPPEKPGGRPRKYPMREVINGLQYVLRGGCA